MRAIMRHKIIIMYAFLSCRKVVTSEAMGHGSTGRVHVISLRSDIMRQIANVSLKPRLKFEYRPTVRRSEFQTAGVE